ncbi:MAG: DoxX family protein, partial [Spirochaetia bacterium]|nr:DoxX family protein [Spirochaetia bacterium]
AVLSKTAALVLPPLELISGTFLIFGVWRMEAALWITVMMAVFLVGDIEALARGLDINCGCFGKEPTKLSAMTMLRNIGLLAGIVFVFFHEWRLRKKGNP